LKFLILKTKVDSGGRCETPLGKAGRLRPPRRLSSRPMEREHLGVIIN